MMPRTLAPLATVMACLLAAGCSTPPPQPAYQRPAAPVAAAFPVPEVGPPPAATGPAAAEIPWQQFHGDPRCRRLIELALDNNRDLRIAVLAMAQARAQLGLRRADETPTVNAGIGATRQATNGGGSTGTYSAGLLVTSWEVDFFGRLNGLSDAAAAQLLASTEARKAAQISLVGAVASACLTVQADEELLRVTTQTLDTRTETLRLTKLRVDQGAGSQIELRAAESLLESARIALAQTQRQRALDENALVLLVGRPLPDDLPAAPAYGSAPPLQDLPAGLPSELLARRPDVRQAEQLLLAARANVDAARAAFFPRISLTGSLGLASTELSRLFSGGLAWSLAPQLLQPLFDGGRNQAGLDAAKAGSDIAVAQYERTLQTAFREVADALAGRATLGEQLRAQQALLAAEQDRAALTELRQRHGAASSLDVLDAQRSLFAARQALVQTQLQQALNGVALYRVLGGGWIEPTAAR
ncbi:Antibiotic efflux pump outer membrane protein ArpC [Rubrivivax sp. A210]|uniref:efflux transporter outer membrane subunit n=1 Tax=Rubrivivax sp. A210 TaxID=2772301 RepID=UPI00191980F5|nr:efflux transporter outer membrane subunit [Rubrivivax sp. A210]CAD5374561.1 Antibiotic efflux pump outer membrane protein ArpC [Rubrivivax sp. A210]